MDVVVVPTGAGVDTCAADLVTARCPASVLQFHPRVTLVLDEAAAIGLTPGNGHHPVPDRGDGAGAEGSAPAS